MLTGSPAAAHHQQLGLCGHIDKGRHGTTEEHFTVDLRAITARSAALDCCDRVRDDPTGVILLNFQHLLRDSADRPREDRRRTPNNAAT